MHSLLSLFAAHSPPAGSAIATMPMSEPKIFAARRVCLPLHLLPGINYHCPESADVTKKTMTIAIAMNDSTEENEMLQEIKQGQRHILLNSIGEVCGPWFIMR